MMMLAPLLRPLPAMAAAGAGLIQLAIAAGVITATDPSTRSIAAGVLSAALIILGPATLAWGLATLAKARIVFPRLAIAAAFAGMLALVAMLVADTARTSIAAVSLGVALLIVVGATCAAHLRTRRRHTTDAKPDVARHNQALSFVGIVAGAVVIASLVTPALASTEAGLLAPDHSEHMVDPGHQH